MKITWERKSLNRPRSGESAKEGKTQAKNGSSGQSQRKMSPTARKGKLKYGDRKA